MWLVRRDGQREDSEENQSHGMGTGSSKTLGGGTAVSAGLAEKQYGDREGLAWLRIFCIVLLPGSQALWFLVLHYSISTAAPQGLVLVEGTVQYLFCLIFHSRLVPTASIIQSPI